MFWFRIALKDIMYGREYQYKNAGVIFSVLKGSEDPFIFIRGDFSDYQRMICNLINNSIEAFDGKGAVVDIGFALNDNKEVEIFVKDNGQGMPKEIADKILNDSPVSTTKKTGRGIGFQQIRGTLKQMNGRMLIDSKENEGTKITLVFPRAETPKWFADQIVFPKGSLVVVLDDDSSVHEVWRNHLEPYKNDITVKYFTNGEETITFINSSKEKSRIFLLTDYELRGQDINGIDVIERCDLQKKSIVVTTCYIYRIKDFSQKVKFIKFLWKDLICDVPVKLKEVEFDKASDANMVVIDDNEDMSDFMAEYFREKGKKVDAYNCPHCFLENLSRYHKNTKIVADFELQGSGTNGFELAEKLHKAGYIDINIISGRKFDSQKVPPYLNVIMKKTDDYKRLL